MGTFTTIEELGKSTREPVVLALGMFDGVHLGHQMVLNSAVRRAEEIDGRPIAFTFSEHPASFLRPEKKPPLLMNPENKASQLLKFGMEDVVLRTFDAEISRVEAAVFPKFLKDRIPTLKTLCIGRNFRFGKNRRGDDSYLANQSRLSEIEVIVAESKVFGGSPISSSRIRETLAMGDIETTNEMLGRNYSVRGVVRSGKAIGRTLGFPTLNLPWNPQAKPAFGVYAGVVENLDNGLQRKAVANYGLRPTLEKNVFEPLLEINVLQELDSSDWKAGSKLSMELKCFLRKEKKFNSIEELKKQITLDKREALELSKAFTT